MQSLGKIIQTPSKMVFLKAGYTLESLEDPWREYQYLDLIA